MQFLCYYYQLFTNHLPVSLISYYIGHIVAVATNYSNLLYQCFTNHYQYNPVLYITHLPMITNKLPIQHYRNHIIGNFLPIGSQCFTIINLPMALGNLPIAGNGLPLVPTGSDIQVSLIFNLGMFLRKSK